MTRAHLDMVGVAGSSPVAPTKQNPVLLPVLEGPTERLALFCCLRFMRFGKTLEIFWKKNHLIQIFRSAPATWYSMNFLSNARLQDHSGVR